jgi:4a-hydroxytetrahydrobiopterin dehydratase
VTDLTSRHALPDGTAQLLSEEAVRDLMPQLADWSIEHGRLSRDMRLRNFHEALALVNTVGEVAEAENHHPDITIHRWNRVRIELYTHSVDGLSINDFILAAKITQLYATAAAHDTPSETPSEGG